MIGKVGHVEGMSGCFGAVVGAPRALDGEIISSRCGGNRMMKKNVAAVGICGCTTSF